MSERIPNGTQLTDSQQPPPSDFDIIAEHARRTLHQRIDERADVAQREARAAAESVRRCMGQRWRWLARQLREQQA